MGSPSSIAHYRIVAKLGEGGMGAVYRATDTKLSRDVAIKIIPETFAADPDRLARFTREAQVLASLNHPNIAAIYGIEEHAIVMELVEGENLSGPLSRETAVRIAAQIADALEVAHEKGIVHRDLKPANIMVTSAGVVKVLDFGLAAVPASNRASATGVTNSPTLTIAATQAGLIMGTAGYMSPEQAAGKAVDRRADIWSFGVVLWEMLTGRPLFSGETVSHTLADVLRKEIDLRELPVDTPPALRSLLARCLDRDVRSRLRDIGEARIVLSGPMPGNQPAPPAAALGPTRRALWPWAIAGVCAAAVPAAWFLKPTAASPVLQFDILPPPGASLGPVGWGIMQVSPDGTRIAFIARDRDGIDKLFVRDLGSGASVAIPGTENPRLPFWSPDSQQIGFLARGHLKRLELTGSRVVDVCQAATGAWSMWHGDGYIYLNSHEHVLRKVRWTGGAPVAVFPDTPQGPVLGSTPNTIAVQAFFTYQILPSTIVLASGDGKIRKTLLPNGSSSGAPASFAANGVEGGWLLHRREGGQLAAIPMDPRTGEFRGEESIIAQNIYTGPSWSASNNGILAYRAGGGGSDRKLTWVDRGGTPMGTIAEQGNVFVPRISPDQKNVVFSRTNQAGSLLYVCDLARGTTTRVSPESGNNGDAEWMPDSRSVLYSVRPDILAQRALFSATGEKIIGKFGDLRPTGVSPDGEWAMAVSIVVGSPRMVLVLLATGKIIPLGDQMKLKSHHASFSPDGRWLVYSAFVNGQWDVFVRATPAEISGKAASQNDGHIQISQSGGIQPMWRADGKEIFYIATGGILTAVPLEVNANGVRPVTPVALFPTTLGTDDNFQREYDATPDGKRFLLPMAAPGGQTEVPITVVINWPMMLEKK